MRNSGIDGGQRRHQRIWRKMEKHLLSENIRSLADSVGIDAVGFAKAAEFAGYALNYHQRQDPKLTLPNAKSIIVAGIYIGGVIE